MSNAGIISLTPIPTNYSAGTNVIFSPHVTPKISAFSSYVEKIAAYTITDGDSVVNCTTNTFTITLPASISGKMYDIKNSGTGVITIDGDGSETIDGELTQELIHGESMTLYGDGSNWYII